MLKIERIDCYYGGVQVLKDVSLDVAPGEILGLLGRNGAGKTTMLRTIMGQIRPRSGRIEFDGKELTGLDPHRIPRHGIAYVPQGRRLFAQLSVEENLRMGLLAGNGGPETLDRVLDLFPVLTGRLRQRAGTLSGGEQQRVAVARVLAQRPSIILADEPVSSLDPLRAAEVLELLTEVQAHHDTTLFMSLHQPRLAIAYAKRIIGLRNGRAVFDGPPETLTDSIMEEIYGGKNLLQFDDAAANSR